MLARSLPSSLVIHPVIPFVRPNPGLPCKRHRLRLRLGVRAHADLLLNPLVAPALAAATAAVALTLLAPRRRAVPEAEGGDIAGTWILYTSPTPFNRCVLLRCPSVSFEDGGQLLRRDRHYVNLSRGCIPVSDKEEEEEEEDGGLSYQRVCVGTADGGVISLDWPHHLDLDKEHGLDTTLLLVPGSTDGSMDRSVRMLVRDALNHGYFPIVMNPRGCAGSPLTTARLFSAGDSDDVSVAAQFINRVRPWTTMMSVAWGFGANMLTKYLAEVGEATPLTAAVCINNPFDLDEATRSFPHHIAVDQKLTSGLIDILRANKELFQGKAKGFDVTKGLSATSVRDFDGAVSMISNGFATIEDFYTNSSTRQSVSDLKIPVLYIQSDDGTVPLFSIPRSSISENPFTSLLLCSCFPSTTITGERSAILWCQHLAIEWLSAVELALLKGRHPLLKDVDITVNPSKGLTLVEDRAVAKSISSEIEDDHLKLTQSNLANGFLASPSTNVFIENDTAARSELNRGRQFHWEHREEVVLEQEKSSNLSEQNGTVNDIPAKRDTEIDSEQSQVLQTASAVMNMLDVTMPGTLDDEQKKKVLTAMEQGETLMKALQGAVPEDVRGKLTTAVTDILQTQGTKVNLDGVRRIGWIPNVASNLKSKIRKSGDDNASDKVQSDAGEGKPQDDSALRNPDSNNTQESINSSQQQATKASENIEADSEMGVKQTQPKKFEKASGEAVDSVAELSNANLSELSNANQGHGESVRHSMDDQAVENDTSIRETKKIDSEAEECMPIPSNNEKAFAAGSPNSDHTVEKSENEVLKNDDQISQDPVDQKSQAPLTKLEEPSPPSSKPTSMSVTQALDALTGFDDSTQMAVNSVFGVIENMIDQLEKASNLDKNEEKDEAENQESVTESHDSSINRDKTENIDDRKNELNLGSDVIQSSNKGENNLHVEDAEYHEEVEKRGGNRVLDGLKSSEKTGISPCTENNAAIKELSKGNINKVARLQNFPIGVGINPYWQLPHQTYFRRYFSTQLRGIQPSDSNSTTDLVLDPKEGRWRMLDQSGHTEDIKGENQQIQSREDINFSLRYSDRNGIIEPSYVILDTEYPEPGYSTDKGHEKICSSKKINNAEIEVIYMIKNKILDALKIEVGRRLGLPKLEEIESNLVYELELVADSVSQVIVCDNELNLNSFSEASDSVPMKLRADRGERIIKAIYSAVQEASYLRKVLPIGVIVGSSLASLRKYFQVTAPHADDQINASVSNSESIQEGLNCQELGNKYKLYVDEKNQHGDSDKLLGGCDEKIKTPDSNSDGIMVGAVTAALGASALLTHHQQKINKSEEIPPDHFNNNAFPHDEKIKNEEAVLEKSQSSLVSSLAEKAMSVAGPVVPTKSDGAVDHERLVAILAELGQKGGMLRLIGKFALLWGGIRGAMSLTDKLISFLHIAERPLFQRLLGFVCMVLLLWSPVVIPLLPTLVQSWTTKISNGFAECSCIIGLYVATTILVILWGKRIRGYDDPLDQYGLHLTLVPAVHHFLKGLLGGVMIILFIHSINALLGYASLSSSSGLPSSTSMVMLLKMYGSLLLLAVRGMVSATGIALVEELLFRSWFLEEVAVDLGYSRAIIVSALAFSLAQRSLHSVPGFLLLSLALFGIKQRAHEKLYAPIGIRTGIMTANFVLHHSHLLKYQSRTPFWLTSTHLWHPFDGVVGLSICGVLAVLFFPIWPLQKNKVSDSHS